MFIIRFFSSLLSLAVLGETAIIPRADPPFQEIPATGKADNTFNFGKSYRGGEPAVVKDIPPAVYGSRSIDLPFGRLYHGNMKFFPKGQLNTPDKLVDVYRPGENDFANQSACGIPDSAFHMSKVAIHPYFLKYADLSRYCMQDVCISFWREDGKSDMMLKVTDICSTDPNDPSPCATPADIKVVRAKVQVMQYITGRPLESLPELMGDQFPEKMWWFFAKCWADASSPSTPKNQLTPQFSIGHRASHNPLIKPHKQTIGSQLPSSPTTSTGPWSQQRNNTNSTKSPIRKKGWPTYPNGLYKTKLDATTSPPITDWVAGAEPNWTSIAGGKGWGKSPGKEVKGAAPVAAGPPGTLAANSSSSAPTTVPISASKQVPAPTPKPTPSRLAAQEDDTCEA